MISGSAYRDGRQDLQKQQPFLLSLDLALRARTTTLLQAVHPDDPASMAPLLTVLYDELHAMAHRHLARERRHHTLQTTALLHEAYLRLVDHTKVTGRGRAYFFAAAAQAMRQVLVDYARKRKAAKRGGGQDPLSLEDDQVAVDAYADELIDLDAALERLAALNARHAHVVECRFFGGLSVEETAVALDVSVRTVAYDWKVAQAWLYHELHGEESV